MTPRTADLPQTPFGKLPFLLPHDLRLRRPPFSFSPSYWGSHFTFYNSRIPTPWDYPLVLSLIALRSS